MWDEHFVILCCWLLQIMLMNVLLKIIFFIIVKIKKNTYTLRNNKNLNYLY